MLSRVFKLNDMTMREIMIPKEKMAILPMDAPMDDIIEELVGSTMDEYDIVETG